MKGFDRLHEKGCSPALIKKVMISICGIFREARRRGLAVTIPTQDIDLDLPERDIARITGLRPGSVRSATHRALKALGQSLEEAQ